MHHWILTILLAFFMCMQSIFTRMYNQKLEVSVENSSIFTLVRVLIIALFFLVLGGFRMDWHSPTMPYALSYGVMLAVNLISCTMAYLTGPFALTSLLISASMVLVTLYGFVFLHEPISLTMGIGIGLLVISVLLLHEKAPEDCRLTPRWWIYTILAFFCNAGCTLAQKLHQTSFPGQYENEFMFYGAVLCAILCLVYCLFKRVKPLQIKHCLKNGWIPMLGIGVACSLVNLLLMVLNACMPASLLFPTLSGLTLLFAPLLGKFLYHEKSTCRQQISYLIGACSVILMNL